PVGLALEDLPDDVRRRVAVEGPPAGEALAEHAAQGPDVRALVDRPPARLLRAHVGDRAEDRAGRRVPSRDRVRGAAIRANRRLAARYRPFSARFYRSARLARPVPF